MSGEPSKSRETRRTFLWLFLFLNSVFLLTSSGRVRVIDEVLPVFQTETLVASGSTAIPQALHSQLFYGKMDQKGRPQAPYPPGPAFVAIPWYVLGKQVLLRLPGVPTGAHSLVTDFTIVSSNATFAALAAALVYLLFRGLHLTHRDALVGSLGLAFGTPLFAYSAWYFSEPLALAALMLAVVALFAVTAEAVSVRRYIWAGLALGGALWVRPAHLLLALVFLAAILAAERNPSRRVRALAIVGGIVALFGLAFLMRNAMLFGNAFDFGYPEAAEAGRRLNTFQTPLLTGLTAFLFSPGKSVFLFAPPILLAGWGIPRLWRENRGLAVVMAAAPLLMLLFYARYTQFDGGYSFGPRYLVPSLFLLSLGCGVVLRSGSRLLRKLLITLFVLGATVNLIGLATSPLEDMAGGKYYDQNFNYRLDYSPLLGQGALLAKYFADPAPAPIGRGWDRWFVYLHKGGVASNTLFLMALIPLAGAIVSGWKLAGIWRSHPSRKT